MAHSCDWRVQGTEPNELSLGLFWGVNAALQQPGTSPICKTPLGLELSNPSWLLDCLVLSSLGFGTNFFTLALLVWSKFGAPCHYWSLVYHNRPPDLLEIFTEVISIISDTVSPWNLQWS